MIAMSKKAPKVGRPATGRTPTKTVFARVSPELADALEAYLSSLRPRPAQTAVVVVALEEYLERVGFWPVREGGAK